MPAPSGESRQGVQPLNLKGGSTILVEILRAAKEASHGKTMTFEHGGHSYSHADLENLGDLHAFLIRNFESELAVIQKRTDERRTKGID